GMGLVSIALVDQRLPNVADRSAACALVQRRGGVGGNIYDHRWTIAREPFSGVLLSGESAPAKHPAACRSSSPPEEGLWMEIHRLDEIRKSAAVYPSEAAAPMTRRERLERWAQLLERYPGRIQMLHQVEFAPLPERTTMRQDNSPIAIA